MATYQRRKKKKLKEKKRKEEENLFCTLRLKVLIFLPCFVVLQAAIVNSQTLEEVARLEKVPFLFSQTSISFCFSIYVLYLEPIFSYEFVDG